MSPRVLNELSREVLFPLLASINILNYNRFCHMRKKFASVSLKLFDNNRFPMEELSEYEIESILLNRVRDVFPHHQKIVSVCDAFWNAVSHSVKKEREQKQEYAKKIENNATIIANTSSQIKHFQNKSANVALQQKVLEKQINNIIKQQETLREEITEGISLQENYALEIVDLEQEFEENKNKKKNKWDGVKRASKAYKSALQFSIQIIDSSEAYDKIRIIFFKLKKDEHPQYYVDLTRSADLWRVDLIHPSLKPNHEEQLKCVMNFKKEHEVSDLTAFLCILRKIFKQLRKS